MVKLKDLIEGSSKEVTGKISTRIINRYNVHDCDYALICYHLSACSIRHLSGSKVSNREA